MWIPEVEKYQELLQENLCIFFSCVSMSNMMQEIDWAAEINLSSMENERNYYIIYVP